MLQRTKPYQFYDTTVLMQSRIVTCCAGKRVLLCFESCTRIQLAPFAFSFVLSQGTFSFSTPDTRAII